MILQVVGVPVGQGSKKAYVNKSTGRAVVVDEKSRALRDWRAAIANAARDELTRVPRPPIDGPIEVKIYFRFGSSKSDPHRFWHAVKPDLDKLVRAVFDALTEGGAIRDDARICALATKKRFASQAESVGCTIEIYPLASEEAELREISKQKAARARRRASDENQERLLA